MGRKLKTLSVLVVLALVVASCATLPGPQVEPPAAAPAPSLDERFAAVAEGLPRFGGMFFDDAGVLNVYLRADDLSPQALEAQRAALTTALAATFGPSLLSRGASAHRGAGGGEALGASDLVLLPAQYDVVQLQQWRTRASRSLALPGVVFTDLDEASNRVRIGVAPGTSREQLERSLQQQGVPLEAVIISEAEPIVPLVTLQDRVRQVRGGLQISYDSAYACTLGFNVVRGGVRGFVTNSHCTTNQGGVDGTRYHQDSGPPGNFIGTEVADPGYSSNLPSCPAGRRCRFSDSAFASYRSFNRPPPLGRIMRTVAAVTGGGPGPIELVLNSRGRPRHLRITGETPFPIAGEILDKVGRTTGWTYGVVDFTCIDVNVAGTDLTMLCQDSVDNAGVGAGDSGSPVFLWGGNNDLSLYGVLWGGNASGDNFVFSAMENIEGELGGLQTSP